ncbi:hypothetical protein GCM10027425_23630 [Alteromonas gracilis]
MSQGAHARPTDRTDRSQAQRGPVHPGHRQARRRTPTLRRTATYALLFTAVPVLLGVSVSAAPIDETPRTVGARILPEAGASAVPRVEVVVPGVILSPRSDARRAERTRRATQAQRRVLADLGTIPGRAVTAYRAAARGAPCGIDWTLVAAIGLVETDHGRYAGASLRADGVATPAIIGPALTGSDGFAQILDTDDGRIDGDRVHDRAVGPMQFIPGTWRWAGADGDGDGRRDPHDIDDAAAATAGYLCRAGDLRDADRRRAAVLTYNQSGAYADAVLTVAQAYSEGDFRAVAVMAPEPEEKEKATKPRKRKAGAARSRREPSSPASREPSPRSEPSRKAEPAPKPKPAPKPPQRPRPAPAPGPTPSPTPTPTTGPTTGSSPSASTTAPAPTG